MSEKLEAARKALREATKALIAHESVPPTPEDYEDYTSEYWIGWHPLDDAVSAAEDALIAAARERDPLDEPHEACHRRYARIADAIVERVGVACAERRGERAYWRVGDDPIALSVHVGATIEVWLIGTPPETCRTGADAVRAIIARLSPNKPLAAESDASDNGGGRG